MVFDLRHCRHSPSSRPAQQPAAAALDAGAASRACAAKGVSIESRVPTVVLRVGDEDARTGDGSDGCGMAATRLLLVVMGEVGMGSQLLAEEEEEDDDDEEEDCGPPVVVALEEEGGGFLFDADDATPGLFLFRPPAPDEDEDLATRLVDDCCSRSACLIFIKAESLSTTNQTSSSPIPS